MVADDDDDDDDGFCVKAGEAISMWIDYGARRMFHNNFLSRANMFSIPNSDISITSFKENQLIHPQSFSCLAKLYQHIRLFTHTFNDLSIFPS